MGDLLRDVITKSNASKEQQVQLVDNLLVKLKVDAKSKNSVRAAQQRKL